MDLSHMNLGMLGLVGAGLLASFWIIFKIAWKVVKIGFFIMAFALGFAICAGLSTLTGHPQPIWALAAEALAFAWGFSLVRSKVAKVITGIAIITCAQFIGKFGFDPSKMSQLGKLPLPFEQPSKPTSKATDKPKTATQSAKKPLTQSQKKAAQARLAKIKAAQKKKATQHAEKPATNSSSPL